MARTRVSLSLNPHELALVQQAMRVFSQAIYCDINKVEMEIPFDGSAYGDNWHLIYMKVEEIRASLGDGEPAMPQIAPARPDVPMASSQRQIEAQALAAAGIPYDEDELMDDPHAPYRPPRKRKSNPMAQARKANRTARKVMRFLS